MPRANRKFRKNVNVSTNRPIPKSEVQHSHDSLTASLDKPDRQVQNWSVVWQVALATTIAAVLTILELNLWARYREIPGITPEFLAQFHPWLHSHVIGHELDRELYVLGLLAYPIQLLLVVGILHWANFRLNLERGFLVSSIPIAMSVLVLWFLWLNSLVEWRYLFLPGVVPFVGIVVWRVVWMLLLFVPFSIAYIYYCNANPAQRSRWERLTLILVPLTLALVFCFQWFDESKLFSAIYPHHFNSIFDANVQLYLGRPLLGQGMIHQYGLYPYFLEPLFQLGGMSVVGFSFVMQTLQVTVFGMIFLGAKRIFNNIIWAIATWFVVVYFIYFQDLIHGQAFDIVYQNNPIRILFPAILICLLPRDDWVAGRRWWISQFIFGLAPFWNFDTGIIVWLTWQAVVWWQCIADAGWKHIFQWLLRGVRISAAGLVFIALACLFFCIYVKIRFGEWPSLSNYLVFQSIFYKSGFAMLPMPLWHPWHVSVLIYGSALSVGIYGLLSGRNSLWFRSIFGLSILGFGIFSYFNGRSHDLVFSGTTYCAILLAGALLENGTYFFVQQKDVRSRIAAWSVAGPAAIGVLFCMSCMICDQSIISSWISKLYDPAVRMPLVDEEHRLLKKWGQAHDELCVLSFNRSGTLSLAAGRASPVAVPSLIESLLIAQSQPLVDYLKEPHQKYVVIDFYDNVLARYPILGETLNELKPRLIELSPSQSLGLFEIGAINAASSDR